MSTALNDLMFNVSLLDKLSSPAKGMMTTMDTVSNRVQSGFVKMGTGAAGLAGASFLLERIIGPAKEMHSAMGEVASLDVAQNVLDNLNATALKFSVKYGESASDFVRSSYDIQSAIAGLEGNELAAFTNASAILAKGTKADTGTITNFVGTMFGIFQKNADAMGKAKWVDMLAGQTATAVQMFKTTGSEMSSAFSTVGAEGQSMGIAMNEQIAILGTLQATMSGSEAGTKYKSFLAGVGKAQDVLGLQFTDSAGKMLPMVDILQKIQGKFGDIDTVAESDLLQKAFGRKEAVSLIKSLSINVDGLSDSINKVGEQTGIQKAIDMANTITDPWDRASSGVNALVIMLGQKMLPLLTPVFLGISDISNTLMGWSDQFPNVSRFIGIAALGIVGLIAGFAALSVAVGVGTFLMAGWGVAAGIAKVALLTMQFGFFQVIPAVWGFTAALLANPITWMVVGVAALIGLVAAAVIYWDTWTVAVVDFASKWLELLGFFSFLDAVFLAWDGLKIWWSGFALWLAEINPFSGLNIDGFIESALAGFNIITQWWAGFKNWLSGLDPFSFIGDSINSVLGLLNKIPGLNLDFSIKQPVGQVGNGSLSSANNAVSDFSQFTPAQGISQPPALAAINQTTKPIAPPKSLQSAGTTQVPAGGISKQISNNLNNSRSQTIGDIHMHNYGQAPNGQQFAEDLAFAAG